MPVGDRSSGKAGDLFFSRQRAGPRARLEVALPPLGWESHTLPSPRPVCSRVSASARRGKGVWGLPGAGLLLLLQDLAPVGWGQWGLSQGFPPSSLSPGRGGQRGCLSPAPCLALAERLVPAACHGPSMPSEQPPWCPPLAGLCSVGVACAESFSVSRGRPSLLASAFVTCITRCLLFPPAVGRPGCDLFTDFLGILAKISSWASRVLPSEPPPSLPH